MCQQARTEKLSLRRPKNCTRRGSSFGQWAPAVEGFQKSSLAMGAAADEDGEEEEEEEKELALLSPLPDEVDKLEVEMELMEESMELPKEVMGEPMEETPNEPGTSSTAAPKAVPPPKVDKKDRAAPEARRPAIGIRAQATSRNVREIVRIRAVCRSSHFISSWKGGSMCTCLIKNLSQRGQRRENRERERKRERGENTSDFEVPGN